MVENLTRAVRELDAHVGELRDETRRQTEETRRQTEELRVETRRRTRVLRIWSAIVTVALVAAIAIGACGIQANRSSQHRDHVNQQRTEAALDRLRANLIRTCEERQDRDATTVARDAKLRNAEAAAIPYADPPIAKLLQQQVDAYDQSLKHLSSPGPACSVRYG